MNTYFKYTLPLLALAATSALCSCSDDDSVINEIKDPDAGKELIAFSGEGANMTRATLGTRAGFSSSTKIVMRIKGEDDRTNPAANRYTQTIAIAGAETDNDSHTTADLLGVGFKHSDVDYKDASFRRFWDDAFGRNSKISVYAVAVPNKADGAKINGGTNDVLPDNILTLTGSVIDSNTNPNWKTISGDEDNKVEWSVSTVQTAATRLDQDLIYSNNIQGDGTTYKRGRYTMDYSNSKTVMGDGYLRWIVNPSDANATSGTFDKGHLVFNHALTWITIKLKEGDGFNNSSNADFIWTGATDQNISLYGFTTHGSLDISTGIWSSESTDVHEITKMDETTGTPTPVTERVLHAYFLPGRNLYDATGNVIKFQIDNAEYYVTGRQIAEAIRSNYQSTDNTQPNYSTTLPTFTTMQAGVNYVVNITVAKKKIDNITAEVINWEEVNSAETTAKNIHTSFTFEDRGTALDTDDAGKFSIYRAKQTTSEIITDTTDPNYTWNTGYNAGDAADLNNRVTADKSYHTDHWETTWYWPNNKTYYHFRAVGDYDKSALADDFVKTATDDYFNITSGASYKDYLWGAPFYDVESTYKFNYSTSTGFAMKANGTDYQISKAIAATDSRIKMLLFHMTSQVFIKVTTEADDQPNKVQLVNGDTKTRVDILRFKRDGTVLMGNGNVSASSDDVIEASMTFKTQENIGSDGVDATNHFFGIVPQTLSRGDAAADKIGIRITTPDGNEYYINDISTLFATVTENNIAIPYTNSKTVDDIKLYQVDYWYPSYQYYYTIKISKTGILNITASVVPWETVTGDLGEINLEGTN